MTTPNRGYTIVPGLTAPDVPYWTNRIAAEIDTDMESVADRVANLEVQAGTSPGGINDAAMDTVYNNPDSTFRQSVDADRLTEAARVDAEIAAEAARADAEIAAAEGRATPVFGAWSPIAPWLRGGWTAPNDITPPAFRLIVWPGGIEETVFRGHLIPPASYSGNSIAFYLHEKYRPTTALRFAVGSGTSVPMNVEIAKTDGAVTFWTASTSPALRPLNNIRYFRD